jgi:hypothetical protein
MFLQSYNCVHCHGVEESLHHLFFSYPFAIACWSTLHLLIPSGQSSPHLFEAFKVQLHLPFFMEIVITMCWAIWTCRNDVIFRAIPTSVQNCKRIFRAEFALVILRAKPSTQSALKQWPEAYV